MRVSPHLCFDGQCRTAFAAYQEILGGTIQTMLTYGESPMAAQVEPNWHDKIVHATMLLGEFELTGVDLLPQDYRKPQGFSVTLTIEGHARATRIFDALVEGGSVHFPFQRTFWSPGYGMLIDRFGVPWEVNAADPAVPA
ncbi:MAG TPA: VOC family protein [Rhizomicrobium sp.]|nr:VOC family protein [Rhizomicrobium sp.]